MIIALTGFMGVGKSTIAERLSLFLYCKYTDLDKIIEHKCSQTIETLFATKGEAEFRKVEEEALEQFISGNKDQNHVLSLGGGALVSEKNRKLIKEKTFCIYLKANEITLQNRIIKSHKSRPLMKNLTPEQMSEKIFDMLSVREAGYLDVSKAVVNVDNLTISEVVGKIITLL
jgi:shikimate kinase